MRCHESRMPVERHDHRPAPTHPREAAASFCVGHHPAHSTTTTTLDCPLPPSPSQAQALSAHLQLTLAFPSPVQSSLALPCCPALPCPCLPSSLPSPIDRPPRKKPPSCLAVPCEQKSCPLSSIHPSSSAAVPSSPSLSSWTALLSSPPSSLLSCLFLFGPLSHLRASETSSRIPSRRAHTPGLWRLLFPGSPNQPLVGSDTQHHNSTTAATDG